MARPFQTASMTWLSVALPPEQARKVTRLSSMRPSDGCPSTLGTPRVRTITSGRTSGSVAVLVDVEVLCFTDRSGVVLGFERR